MRNDIERLQDILEAIKRIGEYAGVDRARFDRDELIQTWMVHNIQIIGEAASQLSEEFRSQHPEISWREISAMRNVIVHAYFRVDPDEVWSAVQDDIPVLRERVEEILQS